MEEDNVKLQFIQNALTQYGEDVMANMVKEINRLDAKDTEALLKSITYKVVPANQFAQGEVKIIFKEYGRMVDMGVGRGRSLKNTQTNRRNKYVTRKAKKIYAPVAFGLINKLIGSLQYGLTNDIINNIKSQLNK